MKQVHRHILGPFDIDNFLLCQVIKDIKKAEKERHNVLLYKGAKHPQYRRLSRRINQLKQSV